MNLQKHPQQHPERGDGVTFITGNAGKFAEAAAVLPGLEQLDIDLVEKQEIDPKGVIEHKIRQAQKHFDGPIIVEDTSVSFEGKNGFPGPLIKWVLKTHELSQVQALALPEHDFRATAMVMVGFCKDSRSEPVFVESSVEGKIVLPRGENGFGWDPIFEPSGQSADEPPKTFGEMSAEEKSRYNMRTVALAQLPEIFARELAISPELSKESITFSRRDMLTAAIGAAALATGALTVVSLNSRVTEEDIRRSFDSFTTSRNELERSNLVGLTEREGTRSLESEQLKTVLGSIDTTLKEGYTWFGYSHNKLSESLDMTEALDRSDNTMAVLFDKTEKNRELWDKTLTHTTGIEWYLSTDDIEKYLNLYLKKKKSKIDLRYPETPEQIAAYNEKAGDYMQCLRDVRYLLTKELESRSE